MGADDSALKERALRWKRALEASKNEHDYQVRLNLGAAGVTFLFVFFSAWIVLSLDVILILLFLLKL